jgi:predicted small metal-binding protein
LDAILDPTRSERANVFEYICEHIIPGCGHEDRDESREDLENRANSHLKDRHGMDRDDDRIGEALKATGMEFIRPA